VAGAVWEDTFDRAAGDYDGPALRFLDHAARTLVDDARIASGDRVLDLATGTGKVAASAARLAGPGGVVGLDLSAGMLQQARRNVEDLGVRLVQGDVETLPFRRGRFDVVLMGFGISFLPAPIATFREIRRVLRPHGRVGLSTTAHDCFAPLMEVFLDALVRAGMPRPRPPHDAWRAVDRPEHLAHVLERAGFKERHARRVELTTSLPDPLEFWSLLRGSAWRGTIDRLPQASRDAVRSELVAGAEGLRQVDGVPLRTPVLIATAERGRLPARTLAADVIRRAKGALG
jgi:SAM-dependent methyltransferase